MELNELSSQVDEVRDSAINLMNKSDRYNKMVEPELTHLNQRWEEISDRLKVKIYLCIFGKTIFIIFVLYKSHVLHQK